MAAKKKNTETVDSAAPSVIAVDARKLSHGLKMTFEGMAMVFDSIGVDVGVTAVKTDDAKTATSADPIDPADPAAEKVGSSAETVSEENDTASDAEDQSAADDNKYSTWYFECNACPVWNCAFNSSVYFSVHQEQVNVFPSCCHIALPYSSAASRVNLVDPPIPKYFSNQKVKRLSNGLYKLRFMELDFYDMKLLAICRRVICSENMMIKNLFNIV